VYEKRKWERGRKKVREWKFRDSEEEEQMEG
jgi:hypothetical protein